MPYCPNCGKQIEPDANFCISCGAQMKPATAPQASGELPLPPPPPDYVAPVEGSAAAPLGLPEPPPPAGTQPMSGDGEQTVGVIPNAKRMKSMGRYDSFALVVTTRRMIVAQLTSEMLTKAANDARENAKSEGKGFFAAWGAQLKTAFTYSGKYLEMPPDSIIAETPGNFALENSAISEIKVDIKKEYRGTNVTPKDFELHIQTPSGTYTYRTDDNDNYTKLLKQVYGERVKMPFGYFSKGPVKIKFGF